MGLRIVTWNVNGIRNPFSYEPWRSKRSFASMFDTLEADIVILQETKIQRKDLRDDMVLVPGWDCYFSFPGKEKGKFGVVIYTRQSKCAPIRAEEGLTGTLRPPGSSTSFFDLPKDQQIGGYPTPAQMIQAPNAPDIAADFELLDSEGRCMMLEFPAFVLLGVYAPATRDETRTAFRIGYLNLLDVRIRNLIKLGKRVVLTGDLNVSKDPLDIANIEVDLRKSGTTVEEYFGTSARRLFNHLVFGGTVWGPADNGREEQVLWDVCRAFHPDREGMYTHWETKKNARPGNYGSRIDYVLCSLNMKDWFSESNIQEGLLGSDHCPVYAILKDKIQVAGDERYTLDLMNPPGMFKNGKRIRQYSPRDILPLSGRLIPDFTGRQSIRDMFGRKPSLKPASTSQGSALDSPAESATPLSDENLQTMGLLGAKNAPTAVFEAEAVSAAAPDSSAGSSTASGGALIPAKRTTSSSSSFQQQAASGRSTKKPRSFTGKATAPSPTVKGQSSIAGFFKPKSPPPPPRASNSEIAETSSETSGAAGGAVATTTFETPTPDGSKDGSNTSRDAETGNGTMLNPPMVSSDATAQRDGRSGDVQWDDAGPDPAAREMMEDSSISSSNRQCWAKLFSKPQVPLCEHGEPCKQMLSKKQGPNFMKYFYMCARPLGPSGDKEMGTQWRCRTFIWVK